MLDAQGLQRPSLKDILQPEQVLLNVMNELMTTLQFISGPGKSLFHHLQLADVRTFDLAGTKPQRNNLTLCNCCQLCSIDGFLDIVGWLCSQ